MNSNWKKVENEAGYPCYTNQLTGDQQNDHPKFQEIIESLGEFNGIKSTPYRTAFKIFALQKQLRVPPLHISSGVFARHQLSLSESSLSLDTAELEAVLADIYFAAEKQGLFTGDIDLVVDLLINLLLDVYDKDRKEPVRVLAAKTLLIILSEESISEKWSALVNCCADHNGCVSPKRLAALLTHVTALPQYLESSGDQLQDLQADVDACFEKSAGMLGVSGRAVAEWGAQHCESTRWLAVTQRVMASRNSADVSSNCAACKQPLIQVLKFKCSTCNNVYFCEKCYLYDKELTSINGHKKSHAVHEIIEGEAKTSDCLSFMKSVRRFFFCTKKRKKVTKSSRTSSNKENHGTMKRKKDGIPAIFTSTVGKASGNVASNPSSMLQDIITQLEVQNRALRELSSQLENVPRDDGELRAKVNSHFSQISTQINRLKIVKENLLLNSRNLPTEESKPDTDRPQAFDLFSPILMEQPKLSKITENQNRPRVLSLDSGSFSVTSKQTESQNFLTVSGDALKPVVAHTTSDSISTVSMNDISHWYNDSESQAPDKRQASARLKGDSESQSICLTEQRYAADNRAVESINDKVKGMTSNLYNVLDRLLEMHTNNFAMDDLGIENSQVREMASEMEGLLGTLIRGVEEKAAINAHKGLI